MTVQRLILTVGAVVLVTSMIGVLVSGIGAEQHQPVSACRNALNIDLTSAWSADK
ncbi:hypothetical protein [Mycobacterium lepromatosis]|uniref:hypothetical protein n=1 Tax=Mycobacterium lepromatosis TaxID=480418 RepID=UPI000AC25C3F|nr:hypothetical protein [Mycobacterium lepromatosis]